MQAQNNAGHHRDGRQTRQPQLEQVGRNVPPRLTEAPGISLPVLQGQVRSEQDQRQHCHSGQLAPPHRQTGTEHLAGLEATNRGVIPLMLEMIDTLGKMIESDMPFRLEERRARVVRLTDMMDQADVTASEKYRRVMEAYQGELEYGRTTEAYSAPLPTTGQTVDFLRVGRTLLIYQTSDQLTTGWFNPATRTYEDLPDIYQAEVKQGLAIAKNEKAPNLVMLPVPGPEAAK